MTKVRLDEFELACSAELSTQTSLKKYFVLNSAEHEIIPAHKYLNANNSLHFSIFEQEKSVIGLSESEKAEFPYIYILISVGIFMLR